MPEVQETIGSREVDQLFPPDLDLIQHPLSRGGACGQASVGPPDGTVPALAVRATPSSICHRPTSSAKAISQSNTRSAGKSKVLTSVLGQTQVASRGPVP